MDRLGFWSCTIAITPAHLYKNRLSFNAMYENPKKPHVLQNSAIKTPEHNIELWQTIQYFCTFETRAPQNQIDTSGDHVDGLGKRAFCAWWLHSED